ncbi:MAG: GTPase Era [Bacteroidales bacterium]|nr:GTPase Era [Bacteroidales bacterium]
MAHKAGFVNIIGNPNVGKSTLMNVFVGEKLSIITSKSQTTRHRILGIVNGEDFQIVYSDTPGVIKPAYKLQESMLSFSKSALSDADVLLYVTDIYEKSDKNAEFLSMVKQAQVPVLLIINKIDQSTPEQLDELVDMWHNEFPNAEIIPTSAIKSFNTENIFNRILELLPESEPFYPKDALTDKTERFFVQEIIREKILKYYKKEIPYATEIEVEEFKEDAKMIRMRAIIYVERETQKGIIIGHKGIAIKKVGVESRKDLEQFFDKQVHIELFVKVRKDWRNKEDDLRQFGYQN